MVTQTLKNQATQDRKKAEVDHHTKNARAAMVTQTLKNQVTQDRKKAEADHHTKNAKADTVTQTSKNQVTLETLKKETEELHIRKEKIVRVMAAIKNLDSIKAQTMLEDILHTKSVKVPQMKVDTKNQGTPNLGIKVVAILHTKKEKPVKVDTINLVLIARTTVKLPTKKEKAIAGTAEIIMAMQVNQITAEMQMIRGLKDHSNQKARRISHSDQSTILKFKLENHIQIEKRN